MGPLQNCCWIKWGSAEPRNLAELKVLKKPFNTCPWSRSEETCRNCSEQRSFWMGEVHKLLQYLLQSFCLIPPWPSTSRDNLAAKGQCWACPTCPPDGSEAPWLSALLPLSLSGDSNDAPKQSPIPRFTYAVFPALHSSWGCFHCLRLVEPHNTCQQQLCPFQDRTLRKESWATASCGHLLPHQPSFTQGEIQNNYTER